MKANALTKETILNYGVTDRGFPNFRVGDTIEVSQIIKDGEKERIQLFEGDVVTFCRKGISTNFLVRRIGANGVGVERIFPMTSPFIDGIEVNRMGHVRRARLFYLRKLTGKKARIKEKRF